MGYSALGRHFRVARGISGAAFAAALLSVLATGGCGETGRASSAIPSARARNLAPVDIVTGRLAVAARSYWTPARFRHARPWIAGVVPAARPSRPVLSSFRVGALFSHDSGGDHFCTASVAGSPGQDLLITAAHCIHGGKGQGYRQDIVFVPGYRDGAEPFGVWVPRQMLVSESWAASSDQNMDVGFIVLQPQGRTRIQQVLGANVVGINQGFRNVVRVTGYPDDGREAITCVNRTSEQSRSQMRFDCTGYTPGTSGSPWTARFNRATHTGMIIGVIGGYQQGGDTPDISYSPYFGDNVRQLYEAAASLG